MFGSFPDVMPGLPSTRFCTPNYSQKQTEDNKIGQYCSTAGLFSEYVVTAVLGQLAHHVLDLLASGPGCHQESVRSVDDDHVIHT